MVDGGLEAGRYRTDAILHFEPSTCFPYAHFIREFLAKVARHETIDMVVSTGDNLEANEGVGPLLEALEPLLDKPGAFVLGSHDYYSPEFKPWISMSSPIPGQTGRRTCLMLAPTYLVRNRARYDAGRMGGPH